MVKILSLEQNHLEKGDDTLTSFTAIIEAASGDRRYINIDSTNPNYYNVYNAIGSFTKGYITNEELAQVLLNKSNVAEIIGDGIERLNQFSKNSYSLVTDKLTVSGIPLHPLLMERLINIIEVNSEGDKSYLNDREFIALDSLIYKIYNQENDKEKIFKVLSHFSDLAADGVEVCLTVDGDIVAKLLNATSGNGETFLNNFAIPDEALNLNDSYNKDGELFLNSLIIININDLSFNNNLIINGVVKHFEGYFDRVSNRVLSNQNFPFKNYPMILTVDEELCEEVDHNDVKVNDFIRFSFEDKNYEGVVNEISNNYLFLKTSDNFSITIPLYEIEDIRTFTTGNNVSEFLDEYFSIDSYIALEHSKSTVERKYGEFTIKNMGLYKVTLIDITNGESVMINYEDICTIF